MVAVVTGNGLGLFNTSLNMLGGGGVLGQGGFGQAGGQALVNAGNGNLVLQFTDRQLSGLGLDLLHTRTYNTQGTYGDADGDGWRWDGERRVALNGELNAAGSSVVRTTGDGHETLYRWNGSVYQSTDGDGAHDSLSWDGARSEWVWTDGSRRTQERYAGASGRLVQVSDAFGTRIDYGYDDAGRLNSVKDVSGQELVLVYNAAGRLERLDTRQMTGGALTQQVYYSYDELGRLASVTTDLTPNDNSISDGKVYTTAYTYDGSSFRIASVSQSDGTSVSFTYELVGGEYRVKTVTDASGTTTFAYDLANRRTDITNGLNQQWSYFYDEAGRLVEVRTPPVDGQRLSTRYAYDADGNVLQVTDGRGNAITYGYDANGNRVLERDAQGNTLRRVYGANNELLNEIRYNQPAIWNGSGWTEPPVASAQVVRHAYDGSGRLRYVVSAGGVVTEYRYNAQGQRIRELSYGDANYDLGALAQDATLNAAQLDTWTAARDLTRSTLLELSYDYRGNLRQSTRYAVVTESGTGYMDLAATVTVYIYSERGELLQTIAARSSDTALNSFGYDGLGRLLSQTDASGTRTYTYNGANRTVVMTNSAGLTQAQAYDAQGRLLSLTESAAGLVAPRLTQYRYDAAGRLVMVQDATGVRSYTFYDEAGRVSAKVDGLGAVTEYRYNEAGQKSSEIRYANLVDTSTWYDGNAVTKTLVSQIRPTGGMDRSTTYAYDAAGRLSSSTDSLGYATTYRYDGRGQLVQTLDNERSTRIFYDADGRVVAKLDGEGYLVENRYDALGRLKQVTRYALATAANLRADGTLEQLRPAATGALNSWYYYDAIGRQIGSIDEQGFVSETVYDEVYNRQQNIRYAQLYSAAVISNDFANVRAAVESGARQISTTVYDSYGRVSQRIGIDGTVTAYEYDSAGRLIREIRAQGTAEARTSAWRYDALGQLLGKLTGEGASRLTAGQSEAQVRATYAQYGLTYSYDVAGRQLSVTDSAGNTLLSYYDAAGRLTHTVNKLGEITENTYNTFGEVITNTRFYERLSSTANLTGGLLTTPLSALTQTIRSNVANSTTRFDYDRGGRLISSINALGYGTTYGYNRYGQQTSITRDITGDDFRPESVITYFSYNKRGELIRQLEDVAGLDRSTTTQYDAFGRVIARTDGRGLTSTLRYDNGGRVVVSRDPLNQSQTIEYDAFGRMLAQTDALGRVTSYVYDDVNRTLTQTLPGGVQVVSIRNRHDELLSIRDGNGNTTTYSYNKNGQLLSSTNALGQTTHNAYDAKSGFKTSTMDASGNITRYSYDVTGRTLTVTDALNVITRYDYDGMGRKMRVTEAAGTATQRVTEYGYDCVDQVTTITQDPNGLGLTTTYSYDGLGRQLEVSRGTVASPRQQVTRYEFDHLGRRVAEYVDPDGLNLTTRYVYNANDQIEQKIQVLNASTSYKTLYAYDSAGRMISTTDALGNRERYTYDAAGNRKTLINKKGDIWTYNYDSLNRLTEEISPQVSVAVGVEANGNTSYNIRHLVTKYTYDNTGNVTSRTEGVLRGAINGVDDLSQARTTHMVYDAQGRIRYSMDALNQVSETIYDASGRVSQLKQYDKALAASTPKTEASIRTALTAAGAQARTTTYTYDAVGRTLSATDAMGLQERYTYDTLGNRITLTNKNGHVWNYKYDSVGRLTEEISPVVGIASLTASGTFQEIRNYLVVTSINYDALGNVIGRTEGRLRSALNAPAASDNMTQARTTAYRYDAAGRQVQIVSPGWYNKALGRFVATSDNTNDTLQIVTKVEYDALGNAISNRVQVNNTGQAANDLVVSYKKYDALGRVTYDIDAMGGVISYGYDALGNQTSLTRHANGIDGSDISRLQRDASQDRTITTSYDALGRKTEVRQPKSDHYLFKQPGLTSGFYSLTPTTQYRYNAFGELVKETLLGVFTNGTTMMRGVETTYYYDNAGRQVG
ncbi:DUF6531 domain-containing protein, partial [Pseudomonas sp. GD04042]|uniref:DUF6531 domain-containing protein n=1 Tax=Pseudomonas sp. GD04042 TaxID=2975425 RepID=UPI00244BF42A